MKKDYVIWNIFWANFQVPYSANLLWPPQMSKVKAAPPSWVHSEHQRSSGPGGCNPNPSLISRPQVPKYPMPVGIIDILVPFEQSYVIMKGFSVLQIARWTLEEQTPSLHTYLALEVRELRQFLHSSKTNNPKPIHWREWLDRWANIRKIFSLSIPISVVCITKSKRMNSFEKRH